MKYQGKYWQKRGIRGLMRNALVFLAALAPALAAHAAVKVDQSPLILQKPLAPNIVLMLDDSGSMAWDFMPDATYLEGATTVQTPYYYYKNGKKVYYYDTIVNTDALRDSANNGTYYDPTQTYSPPNKAGLDANGNSLKYPNSPGISNAYNDGFLDTTPVDISSYASSSLCDYNGYSANKCPSNVSQSFLYYTSFPLTTSYAAAENCASGYTYYNSQGGDLCYKNKNNSHYYYITPCPSGGSYNANTQMCSGTINKNIFTYTTGPKAGPYTKHYVGQTGECSLLPSSAQANCTDTAAAQQNVANWFSYYRTRILMAKTGLTLAFASLDPSYRFGFGSINGQKLNDSGYYAYYENTPDFGAGWIKANIAGKYSFETSTNSKNYLAEVQKFGDGTANTQKSSFWTWLTKETPGNGTPLRGALKAVGQYYQTAQPWLTDTTDSTATATNAYACRPAYTILTTDGFWNGTDPSGIGDADNQNGVSLGFSSDYTKDGISGYKQPNCDPATDANCKTYVYKAEAPYKQDSSSDTSPTLADVAMYYWKNDLQSNLDNEVPATPNDPAFWQHMTTFTVGLGFDPVYYDGGPVMPIKDIMTWARTGTAPNPPFSNPSAFAWPTPSSSSIKNISDLAHAAVNGHGDFFSAKSPDEFVEGIKSALASIASTPGAGNAITQSGTTLPTVSSSTDPFYQFRATYTTGQWTGTLTESYYDSTLSTPGYVQGWSTDSWSPTFDTTSGLSNRNVWTTKDGTAAQSVAFKKASDLSSAEQSGLAAYTGTPAQTMLNYLLGDNTYEAGGGKQGATLRARKAILGDVVSSTPVYVAAPDKTLFENATFTGASTYQHFVNNNKDRAPIVYVAANDGMLHAFRVTSGAGYDISGTNVTTDSAQPAGTEVYAYMPEAVLTQTGTGSITNLANPNYGVVNGVDGTQAVPHQYYNDGRITVQNVYFSSDSSWHTVLVGTTGRGPAKAIYALDITDPNTLMNPAKAKNALLWERSAGDGKSGSDYIGEMTGVPVIAQVKQDGATDPSWAVFMGNGYNSAQNKAALLQFNLQTGALTVHTTNSTIDNGLAEPGVMQGDTITGVSTYAFGGDLFGNVWKFDLSTSTSTGSTVFTAKDANGATQPITSLISLTYDSGTDSTFALFGTGKYLAANPDINDAQVQTWYGIRVGAGPDLSGAVSTARPVVTDQSTRADLTERYAVDLTGGDRATSLQTAGDMDNKVGWYMDLPDTGERIVNRTQFIAGVALVTTMIPKVNDPCKTIPAGAIMFVDPFTGANQTTDYGLGTSSVTFPGQSAAQTVAVNGQVLASGAAGGVTAHYTADGTVSISFNTLDGDLKTLDPLTLGGGASGRVSWRELVN